MAPDFMQAAPDAALRFLTASAVNRRVASPNLARGAKTNCPDELTEFAWRMPLSGEGAGGQSKIFNPGF